MTSIPGNYHGVDHLALEGVSKLIEGEDFEIPYGFLSPSVDQNGGTYSSLDGSRITNGSAHDDTCVDGCSPMVHYNTTQAMNQRGVSSSFQPRLRHSISDADYSCLQPQSFQFDMAAANPRMDYKNPIGPSASGQFQDNGEWGFVFDHPPPAFPDAGLPGRDEDKCSLAPSSTTCDSACDLDNRCVGVACANTDDACTDRNCPDVPARLSYEVVNAAAALTSIGGAPGPQQPDYHVSTSCNASDLCFPFDATGLPASHAPFDNDLPQSLLPDNIRGITTHLLWAHSDPDSSSCTRPCPIDDPHVFGHCHFPYPFLDGYTQIPDSMPMYPYDFVSTPFKNGIRTGSEECGAEIMSPDEFIQHFNAEHRQELASVMSKKLGTGYSLPPTVPSSSSSANPFDMALLSSQASLKEPSPMTPLSNPHDAAEAERTGLACRRSLSDMSLTDATHGQTAPDWENRCLWCDDIGSELCGKTFGDAGELFAHVNAVHIKHLTKGPRGFRCGWENCRREDDGKDGFPQRSKIERHMQTHIEHKPYSCSHCGKKFSAKQALNQHLLIHSNEKPLICDWPGCGKTFRQQSALTMHKRVHTGEKPLKCDICGRTFSESSNLSKHKRTHEVKGRFTCPHPGCGRDFHRQDQLRRHMKLHAGKHGAEMLEEIKNEEMAEEDWSHDLDESSSAFSAKQLRLISHTPPVADHEGQPRRKKRNR